MRPVQRLTCRDTLLRLDDYIDRILPPLEIRMVEEHLEDCPRCQREFQFETTLTRDLKIKLQRLSAPQGLLTTIRRRLQAGTFG